jgi:hypothetical protein
VMGPTTSRCTQHRGRFTSSFPGADKVSSHILMACTCQQDPSMMDFHQPSVVQRAGRQVKEDVCLADACPLDDWECAGTWGVWDGG